MLGERTNQTTARSIIFLVAMGIALAGCSNHRFNDGDYRPLGESQTEQLSS